MNETFDQVQLTQILYEISMSIGSSVELHPMLKNSLSTILKKLNCVAGSIYQQKTNRDGSYQLEVVYTIPRHPQRNATYQEALGYLPDSPTESQYADFLTTLPFVGQSQEDNFYHILELPNFGFLILVKNKEALSDPLIKSLTRLLNKLAAASVACINEAKLRQNEERYRMFTHATFDGIMVHDGPIVTEINPALAETISYAPEELVGTNIFDFLDPSSHNLARANAIELTKAPYELLAVRKDGTRLPIEVTDREYIEDGKTYRVTAVRDLSHQKQLETELKGIVEQRTRQVEVSTQVAQAIAQETDLEDLYKRIVTEVKEQFGYYHTQLLRYNPEIDAVTLIAGYGKIGDQMQADGHKIPMGKGLIGTAAATGQSVLRHDLAHDPDWAPNPLLPDTKSEIAVPIKLGEEVLGVLDVQSNIVGAITSNDQLLLEGLCGQIAVAINSTYLTTERLKTEKALQKSQETLQGTLEREQILHDVSLELSSIQDLDELYQQIIVKARERLGFDRIGLFLVNLSEEILNGTYGISPDGELKSIKHDVFNFSDGEWVKKLVYSQERIFVREDTDLLEGQEVIGRGWHLTASMKIRGTLIGIIFADNMVSQQPFQPHLPELLSAYSTDAANLIDRLHAYKALHQSEQTLQEVLDQQKALLTVSQNLTSINDPDELYKQVIQQAQEHLGFDRLGLYLLDIENGIMRGTYGIDRTGKLRSEQDNTFSFKTEPWINDFIYNTERIIVKEDENLYERDEVIGRGWHMVAAIWQEDKPMGVLFADNLLSQAPLLPSQPDTLTAYASTIAQLIDRIQAEKALLESEQTIQTFVNKQKDLHEVGLQLSNLENPDDLYKEAIQLGHTVLGYDRLGLYLVDTKRKILHGTFGIDVDGKLRNEDHEVYYIEEEPWTHELLYHNERLIVNEDTDLHEDGEVVGHGWNLTATLLSGGKPIGLLFADNLVNHQPLQPHQPELLTAFSATISNLIERQQVAAERMKDLELAAEISRNVSQIRDINDLSTTAVRLIRQRFNLYHVQLYLADIQQTYLTLLSSTGEAGQQMLAEGHRLPINATSLNGRAAVEKQPILVSDTSTSNDFKPHPLLPKTQSETAVPLLVSNNVVGVLDLQSDQPNTFTKENLPAFLNLAGQLAIAIENSALFTETTLQAERLTILNEMSTAITSAANMDEVYKIAGRFTQQIVGGQRASLSLLDPDGQTFEILGLSGEKGAVPMGTHLPVAKTSVGLCIRENRLIINADGHPENYADAMKLAEQGLVSFMNAPIVVSGKTFGAINIASEQADTFGKQEGTLMQQIASLLGGAIENRQLLVQTENALSETSRQAERLSSLNEMSTAITTATDMNEVYKVAGAFTQKIVGGQRASLGLLDPDGQTFEILGLSGEKGAIPMGTHLPVSKTAVGLCIRENRIIIDADGHPENYVDAMKLAEQGLVSLMSAPIVVGGKTIGSLNIGSNQANAFSSQESTLMQQISSLLSSSIENATLFAELSEEQAQTQAVLESIGTPVVIARVSDGTLLYINEPTAHIFGVPRQELLGQATPNLFQNADDRQVYVSKLRQDGQMNNFEVVLQKEDGTPFWALLSGKIVQFQGEPVTITSFVDITEQKEAAAAIQASEYRYQQILDSLTQMVLVKGDKSSIVWANKTFREYYGMSNEALQEMIDAPFNEPDYTQQYVKDDAYVFETGQVLDIPEEPVTRYDGHVGIFHTLKSPIFNEADEVIMTVGISEEISERKKTEAMIAKQATELQTVAELSAKVSLIEEPQEMLEMVVQETQKRFNLYHCHVFLMDEADKNLRIRACGWHPDAPEYGTHGTATLSMDLKQSLVVQAAHTQQAVIVNDVLNDPNWLPNELLPDTRSEMAVPLIMGNKVLGVLDVQSSEVNHFTDADIKIKSTLAAQVAIALERARSAARTQEALNELNAVTRQLTRESWEEYLTSVEEKDTGFVYNLGQLSAVDETDANLFVGETAVSSTNGHLSQSLMVHGESIGHLTIFDDTDTEQLGDDAALIMAAVAEQLSARVENIRLTDQTQQALAQTQNQAQRLGLLNEISAEMSNVDTLNQVFDVIFARIPDLLKVDRVSLTMLQPDQETLEIIGYQGEEMDSPTGTLIPLAGTVMEQAITENRVLSNDITDPDSAIRSSMIAPLNSAGRSIGTLNIGSKKTGSLTDRDRTLMQQLATMLSSVIENKQLLAAAHARAERERQVRTITDKIRRGVDREAILTIAQKEISTLIGAKQSAAQLGTKTQLLERIQQTLAQSQQGTD